MKELNLMVAIVAIYSAIYAVATLAETICNIFFF